MRTSQLRGLLAGLDRLDPLLSLPRHPQSADPTHAFGRYQLRARLGAGAHGIVFLADDQPLDRQVVVKVPQPSVLTDPELRERFVREARAAAALEHPGIVPVFEAGEIDELPYLVAGYVPGPSLAQWLEGHSGPVPPRTAAELVATIAAAVHHAHQRGVLHCDLTPSNVLLAPTDSDRDTLSSYRPVVTDFGLARLTEEDPALTQTFRIVGTPLYMAPEQARGERRKLTARTDVYALGAILYHLLTGHPPHVGESTSDALRRIVTEPVASPQSHRLQVPRDLSAICLKCLEKDQARRYSDGDALAADLGRFLGGLPTLARPVRWPAQVAMWVRRNPLVAALSTLVAATLVLMAVREWAYRNELSANNTALQSALIRENAAATEADQQRALAVDRYRVLRRRTYLAEIREAATLADRGLLTDRSVGAWEPVYGEDLRGFEWAYLTHLAGGTRTWPRCQGPVNVGTISDDGRWCATTSGREVRIWEVTTGRPVAEWTHAAGLDTAAVVSGDGRHVATATTPRDGVLVFTRGRPEPRRLKGRGGLQRAIGFVGDDLLVEHVGPLDGVKLYDVSTGAPVRVYSNGSQSALAFAPGGRTLAIGFLTGVSTGNVEFFDPATGRELRRFQLNRYAQLLASSSDGAHVLAGHSNILDVFSVHDGGMRATFTFPTGAAVKAVGHLADGSLAGATWPDGASGRRQITLAIWNPRTNHWATRHETPLASCSRCSSDPMGAGSWWAGWTRPFTTWTWRAPPLRPGGRSPGRPRRGRWPCRRTGGRW